MKPILSDKITLPSGAERSAFDTNIPGQSWTKQPGLYPWDKPPMFNTADEVMDHFASKFNNEDSAQHLIGLLSSGIPVDTIVDSMLLAGFSEGMFTPDVAILTAEDLGMLIMYLGDSAGIKYKVSEEEDEIDVEDVFHQLARGKKEKKEFEDAVKPPSQKTPEVKEEVKPQGIMAKKEAI
tara:strand:- start:209 stop:748 length:540 start_codon:yes stop_codon:yes gene_type:complete